MEAVRYKGIIPRYIVDWTELYVYSLSQSAAGLSRDSRRL